MKKTSGEQFLPTLVSLWSAMIGGAAGALIGVVGPPTLLTSIAGFCFGFLSSVVLNLMLMALFHLTSLLIQMEFSETPIGCGSSDTLSGVMGGIAGLIGATTVAWLPLPSSAGNPRTFFVCWSISAFIPLAIALTLIVLAQRQNHD
jgi:hypothetical protein